ncbi:hypothetical protein MU458_16510, partial [Staphylococcus aureus]|nr:hypothetical protein [Staphylococcus aureus]
MSNTQKKNVPELRFPGFEGEWEEKKSVSYTHLKKKISAPNSASKRTPRHTSGRSIRSPRHRRRR